MGDFLKFIGILAIGLLLGLLRTIIVIKIASLYMIDITQFKFYQVYGVITIISLFINNRNVKEKQTIEEQLIIVLKNALGLPLLVWFFAWIMSLVLVP